MRHTRYDHNYGCVIEAALETIGGKWKGVILHHLMSGTKRFNELRRLMPAVTQRVLTAQLRSLEANGIVRREVFAEVPSRVEYSITEFGRTLEPVLESLRAWGREYLDRLDREPQGAGVDVSAERTVHHGSPG